MTAVLQDLDADLAAIAEAGPRRSAPPSPSASSTEPPRKTSTTSSRPWQLPLRRRPQPNWPGWRCDETGYGVYEDKILKNRFNADFVAGIDARHADQGRAVGGRTGPDDGDRQPDGRHRGDHPGHQPDLDGDLQVPGRGEGRATPSSTPRTPGRCGAADARSRCMAQAAERAGAPAGVIGCLEHAGIAATGELMRHPDVSRWCWPPAGPAWSAPPTAAANPPWRSAPATSRSTSTAACRTSARPPR